MKLKSFVIAALIVLCVVLAYRIFDLGVSYSYLNDALKSYQSELRVVSRFQRLPCSSIDTNSKDLLIFKKEGLLVIDGFEFECKLFPGDARELLHNVGRGKGQ